MPSTTIGEHIGLRRARNQTVRNLDDDPTLTHVVLPISQPNCFCNSAVSSFFLLPTSSNETTRKKQYNFPQTTSFRGMGCTAAAAQEVSIPSVIRSSADWDSRIRKDKKKNMKKKNKRGRYNDGSTRFLTKTRDVDSRYCVANPDVWCGSSTDAVLGQLVNPPLVSVPPRRSIQSLHRKIDVDKTNYNQTEFSTEEPHCYVPQSSSVLPRRVLNQESHSHPFFNSDSSSHTEQTFLPSRYCGHLRRPYPHDLSEILMLQNGFVVRRTTDPRDHFHDLRLDVDNMSYEQLLELGDRIGYVNTGLKDSETHRCLQKINLSVSHALADKKCSICQDEYERDEQVGKLECGHTFHVQCVKQWLSRKNACPVCKKTAYVKP